MKKDTKKMEKVNMSNTGIDRREFLQKTLKLSMAAAIALAGITSPDNAYGNNYGQGSSKNNQVGINNVCYNNTNYVCYSQCYGNCHGNCHSNRSWR